MMEYQKPPQPSLFYQFSLERRVPNDHPLRTIAALVDFDFVYAEVEDLYGTVGKPSVPPTVILKLMFLLAFENVSSERRLMATLPMRLDWLWFLGMDLDSAIPDHSVLSKARSRWGVEAFRTFFGRVIQQAVDAGLIDGRRIFCDGSLFDANASRESIVTVQVVDMNAAADELERRLQQDGDEYEPGPTPKAQNRSTTDPEAAVVTKPNAGAPRPRYKAHRAVDDAKGVITATEVTAGDGDEGQELEDLINQHEHLTGTDVDVVIADTQYGTSENYVMCLDRGITPHMPLLSHQADKKQRKAGRFCREDFLYEEPSDTYRCPAGKQLVRTQNRTDRDAIRYSAGESVCGKCELRDRCTDGRSRSITRHVRQAEIDLAHADLKSQAGRRDLKRRKHLMEGSFAVATRYGFKRCRWRGLAGAAIHELLVATIQNIMILLRNARTQWRQAAAMARQRLTRREEPIHAVLRTFARRFGGAFSLHRHHAVPLLPL